MMQVIKESQRLFPAAAIGPIRMAAENAELGGYFIPKGTRVQVSHTATFPSSCWFTLPVRPGLKALALGACDGHRYNIRTADNSVMFQLNAAASALAMIISRLSACWQVHLHTLTNSANDCLLWPVSRNLCEMMESLASMHSASASLSQVRADCPMTCQMIIRLASTE